MPPSTIADWARDALTRGQAALVAGDKETAIRWLDRAARLAPTDRSLTLALAAACLGTDPGRAATLFARVSQTDDVREIWLGLAATRLRLGDTAGAAEALVNALQRHAPDPTLLAAKESLADQVARAAGAVGWCGLCGDGTVAIRPNTTGKISLGLDGKHCPGPSLPDNWRQARKLTVRLGARHLLGSPIDIAAIRRCVGFVQAEAGALRGWAWHPGDPASVATLTIDPAEARSPLTIAADQPLQEYPDAGALARPGGFFVPAEALAKMPGLLHVLGPDGRDLIGSPLDPGGEQRSAAAAAATLAQLYPASKTRRRFDSRVAPPAIPADVVGRRPQRSVTPSAEPPDVVIPVYGNAEAVAACLESVLASVKGQSRIVVVDDASPDADVAAVLKGFGRRRHVQVLRRARNGGFPAAANDGIAGCSGRDVVLLNSDALVPTGWLERLRQAAYSAPDIGTATPLTNHGTILSYPGPAERNPQPTQADTVALDRLAQVANAGTVVDIPVGVGFCLYIRRDCLNEVGLLRTDVFAQGYGEESDFCMRARYLGWRHIAVPGLFVGHAGGGSFGSAARHLQTRNQALMERLHPGYSALVQKFQAQDPLAEPRRRLDVLRWQQRQRSKRHAAILVTHDAGGGVERQIAAAVETHRAAGRRPIVLRPVHLPDGTRAVQVGDGIAGDFPNLRYRLPEELPLLAELLRAERPRSVEVHHLVGHPPAIHDLLAHLALPYSVHVHDYAWFCPRISLVGGERRYCGEPALSRCEACVADHGALNEETIGVGDLRERSGQFLAGAARVVAPSEDTAVRMRRHFPALRPVIVPHEDDSALADPPPPAPRNGRCRVCVLGAIGVHKGYDILLACARDAVERQLPLEFVVVGHTTDDARLLATGRVFITGRYESREAVAMIMAQQASIGLLPSITPETWSLGLTELWRAGLRVAAFDFGAPAERIRRSGRGLVLPVGMPPRAINNTLVAASGLTVHEGD